MKLSLKSVCAMALVSLALVGCQSAENGKNVKILSEPTGASVCISGVEAGMTPLTVSLPQYFSTELRVEKTGFKPELITVSPSGKDALKPNPVRAQLIPAFMPDDPSKANYEVAQQALQWMKDSGQYDKKDLAYIEAYVKKYFRK